MSFGFEGALAGMYAKDEPREMLRDRFAMAALQGLLGGGRLDMIPEDFADLAYRYADLMLAARKESA